MKSAELLEFLKGKGVEVKTASSSVEDDIVKMAKDSYRNGTSKKEEPKKEEPKTEGKKTEQLKKEEAKKLREEEAKLEEVFGQIEQEGLNERTNNLNTYDQWSTKSTYYSGKSW